jgi:hypothetical protein
MEELAGAHIKRPYRPPPDTGDGWGERGEWGEAHRAAKRRRGRLGVDGNAEETDDTLATFAAGLRETISIFIKGKIHRYEL